VTLKGNSSTIKLLHLYSEEHQRSLECRVWRGFQ
jgi:hypothetical protein